MTGTVSEEALLSEPQPGGQGRPRHLLTLAAATDDELKRRASELAGTSAGLGPGELCVRAAAGRGEHRLAVTGPGAAELVAGLTAFGAGQKAPGLVTGRAGAPRPRLCFLCTGQGSQYAGMGRELYETEPVYREVVDACALALAPELEVPLVDVMLGKGPDPALVDQTLYTQPSLFALESGLARLLASFGVEADVVLGHSVGEYVAATLAGVLSLEDGVRLIARRARLMQSLPAGGKMSALTLGPDEAAALVAPYASEVSLAAANGDQVSVIAGAGARIDALGVELEARGVTVTPLTVSHAFHSPLMDPMLDELERFAGTIRFSPPRRELVSNVSGQLAGAEVCEPSYWRRHVREPVMFAKGVRAAWAAGCRVFVELGPNPVLAGMARPLVPAEAVFLPTLRRRRGDWQVVLDAAAELFVRGFEVSPGARAT